MNTCQNKKSNYWPTLGTVVVLLISVFFSGQIFAKGLSSVVDRTRIATDESITLKVIFDAFQAKGEPDFSGLKQNFDIVSNNRSTQQSWVNGDRTASTEWRMVLFPKKSGQLLIPPFSLQGYTSKPISITVSQSQPATTSAHAKPNMFIETVIDKTDIYVQEQAILTYKLFFDRNVSSLDSSEIIAPNLKVEELPRADYQKTIGQKAYGVAEFRYALIPDASGEIKIPSHTWTIETTDQASNRFGFNGGRRKLHRVKTDAISIHVKPKPDNYPLDKAWLPASDVRIAQAWSQPPEKFKVGEPITRTVTLQAEGVAVEQLPPIFDGESIADFKFYPDKPSQESHTTGTGLAGTRTESVAIVPNRSGNLTLPEISVTWWDTTSQSIKKATLPAVNITIAAATTPQGTPLTSIPAHLLPTATTVETKVVEKTSYIWVAIAALSLLGNAILAFLFWRVRNAAQKQSTSIKATNTAAARNVSQAFSKITQACSQKDPQELRLAILAWAALKWPNHKVSRLLDLEVISSDTELNLALKHLNAALFSEHSQNVDYDKLQGLLKAMPATKPRSSQKASLQPLYGT